MESSRSPWFGVELRHLSALVAVARLGSFRAAASSLGYVQSAVSQQLAQLEQIVGERLVERERGAVPVALTPAGELLLGHAEKILSRFGAAQADLDVLRHGGPARLRVGACASLAGGMLPRLLPPLLGRLPELGVEASEASPDELAARVAGGALDAAFAELPLPEGPFVSIGICDDPYVLLAPPEEAPSPDELPPISADLEERNLIEHPLMQRVEPSLRASGIVPRYGLRCWSLAALPTLVAAGLGYAIVPRLFGVGSAEQIVTLSLDRVIAPRRICAFWHADREDTDLIDLVTELAAGVFGMQTAA
jgi:DNA-binding transcriptional LysR family regulator